ncbi:Crp/Fnr family transcriptional regulator [Flagellimonas flava]|uniref:cAMP-binding domain of CRP or a regulatory subunit of cAMP-dependent protein kinases n=1 Tax=Flagellimonas flava TaxID=570519 RepID=A0A1M5I3U4_9FLAO|nr:Crp/Fnr family transcriptional regulator [Allomuricauda flava]SHG22985.1 cAMP-binding domain of CRP or a regulatory subunit of cAMP-dependent protein kinases [Allomuricauda flava]
MSFGALLQNVSKHIELTAIEQELFTTFLTEKKLEKGAIVLEQGGICNAIHFVNEGILRAYFLSEEGKETTVMFAISDWWITDMHAFTTHKKSLLTIQALEKSSILSLSKANFDKLLIEIPKLERFFRILMQNAYIREQLRGLDNLSLPAKQKYAIFMEKYPSIAKLLTQKQIASYLGITPEFLSIIRADS